MIRRAGRPFVLISAVLLVVACDVGTGPVVCTAIAVESLSVTVTDAATGARLCDATVIAVEGSFRGELRRFPASAECTYSGPTERAGRYELQVTRAGYEPAVRRDVVVGADECHVIPVRVSIELRRTAGPS